MKVNILGTEYTISVGKENLSDGVDGTCDETVKRICVDNYADCLDKPDRKQNLEVQHKKVLRHEILHAFCFESGLAECSDWAQNEEMIDFIAIQAPKIIKAWTEAGAL